MKLNNSLQNNQATANLEVLASLEVEVDKWIKEHAQEDTKELMEHMDLRNKLKCLNTVAVLNDNQNLLSLVHSALFFIDTETPDKLLQVYTIEDGRTVGLYKTYLGKYSWSILQPSYVEHFQTCQEAVEQLERIFGHSIKDKTIVDSELRFISEGGKSND